MHYHLSFHLYNEIEMNSNPVMSMTLYDFIFYQVFFILVISVVFITIIRGKQYREAEHLHNLQRIIFYGFIGWIIAFLRIILIQIYQVLLLVQAGVDINNVDAISTAPITQTYLFNIIGPLLSGIFEEGVRYFLLMRVIGEAKNRVDRKYIPVIFGMSWAYSEILILTLGFIGSDPISTTNLFISGYERLIAMMAHVSFTYLVYYAKYTNKKSLWISIILHTVFNLIALVMVMEVGSSTFNDTLLIEAVLTVFAFIIVGFTYLYLKPIEQHIQSSKDI